MSVFNTRFSIPGSYSQVITLATSNRNLLSNTIGVVGPAKGGVMGEVLAFSDPEQAYRTLGACALVDYLMASWSNGAGLIKVIRVGESKTFDEVWDADSPAVDITTEVAKQFGSVGIMRGASGNPSDYVYVGSENPFDSVYFKVTSAAAVSSGIDLTGDYWNGTAWTALALTDGTVSSLKTMQAAGSVTFVAPANWVENTPSITGANQYYWARFRMEDGQSSNALTVSMITITHNALKSYGTINEDYTHTDSVTTGASATAFTASAATYTSATYPVEVGDLVTNVTDGSTALVTTVSSGTALVTTALSGGITNKYQAAQSRTGLATNALTTITNATTGSLTDNLDGTSTFTVTSPAVTFITNKVSAGDVLTNTTTGTSRVVVEVLSETSLLIANTGVTFVVAFDGATDLTVTSRQTIKLTSGKFVTDNVRPGQILNFGVTVGTAEVVSVIDENYAVIQNITGTFTPATTTIAYDVVADVVTVFSPVEKAVVEAIEPGTNGNNISFQVYVDGAYYVFDLSTSAGYTEQYQVATTDSTPLTTLVALINAGSSVVTAEAIDGATDTLPSVASLVSMTGGADGSADATDYQDGLRSLLSEEDVTLVYATDNSDAVNAAVKAHVGQAEGSDYQIPRIGFVSKPDTENFLRINSAILNEASAMSYNGRMVYGIQRATISSLVNADGLRTDRIAFMAAVAGRAASLPSAEPLTWKGLNVVGLDKNFNRAEQKQLIDAGIFIAKQDANGILVVRSVTPTTSTPYYELSVRRAVDTTDVDVRKALEMYVGRANERGIEQQMAATVSGVLARKLSVPGDGGTLRDYRNIRVSFNAVDYTRVDVSYEILPLSPINFVFTTMYVSSGISFTI